MWEVLELIFNVSGNLKTIKNQVGRSCLICSHVASMIVEVKLYDIYKVESSNLYFVLILKI